MTKKDTKQLIIEAAEELFAADGYHNTSLRSITQKAKVNLAAVNYHFGNKMNLYLSVFKERWVPRAEGVRNFFRKYLSEKNNPDTADMVRAIATAFLEGAMTDNERRCHINLMLRELTHPTEAINIVVSEVIRPMHHNIRELIRTALPESVSLEQLTLSIFCIISMIVYFGFAQPVVSRVMDQEFDPQFKSRVIDHIVAFSMDGINGIKDIKSIKGITREETD